MVQLIIDLNSILFLNLILWNLKKPPPIGWTTNGESDIMIDSWWQIAKNNEYLIKKGVVCLSCV